MLTLRRDLISVQKAKSSVARCPEAVLHPRQIMPFYDAPQRMVMAHAYGSCNGAVTDKPSTSTTLKKENKSVRQKPPTYKVLLHNDHHNSREGVVKVLLKVVEGLTINKATHIMQEAHETGVSMVTQEPQEVAEKYCENLRLNGLTATIEA